MAEKKPIEKQIDIKPTGSMILNVLGLLNLVACSLVVVSFVLLFGFEEPAVGAEYLHIFHIIAFAYFVLEKSLRFLISQSGLTFLRQNWLEIPMLIAIIVIWLFAERFFEGQTPEKMRNFALGVYLIIQVVDKMCRFTVGIAATGRNTTRTLVTSFVILIVGGAAFLKLPTFHATDELSFVDALFTTTSAACITGLIVKDTGSDFTIKGQVVILILMQLGGLGIVIFGAIIAQLFGKAFSIRESVAMQDLLSEDTVSRIGRMIGFIFTFTIIIELIGVIGLYNMWNSVETASLTTGEKVFYSVFHSVSAFCNAGFSLFEDSFINYSSSAAIYFVICPLIVLGGLGFGVLYNIVNLAADKMRIFFYRFYHSEELMLRSAAKRLRLQSKIVLVATLCLIVFGTAGYMVLIRDYSGYAGSQYESTSQKLLDSLFMSITSRTAGFNTVDVGNIGGPAKLWTIVLMCIGGSPGSTAGGIKTVTFMVLIMTIITAVRGRNEVEMFKRSISYEIIGKAITVLFFYVSVLLLAIFILSITENQKYSMMDIAFEAASALGTVGLSTGITSSLSTEGKIILIGLMIAGRLGPLTLLASFMLKMQPRKYSYPVEPVVVG